MSYQKIEILCSVFRKSHTVMKFELFPPTSNHTTSAPGNTTMLLGPESIRLAPAVAVSISGVQLPQTTHENNVATTANNNLPPATAVETTESQTQQPPLDEETDRLSR